MTTAKLEIYQAKKGRGKGRWRWRTVAKNGRIIGASTESYINRSQAFKSAFNTMLALHSGLLDIFEVV